MALSSHQGSRSVVGLSESYLFHYQYSSISDVLREMCGTLTLWELEALMRSLCLPYVPEEEMSSRIRINSDATSLLKADSPTLENRGYVLINNQRIKGNKPVGLGYQLSRVHISLNDGWSLPLSERIVSKNETASELLLEQLENILKEPWIEKVKTIIHCIDSGYGHASFLVPMYAQEKVVNIVRFRHGIKVWSPAKRKEELRNGAPLVYGQKHYLNDKTMVKFFTRKDKTYEVEQKSITEMIASEKCELYTKTKKGRQLKVYLERWNDLLIRSKEGHCTKDKPFDIVRVRYVDAKTGAPIHQRAMFLSIFGKQKAEVSIIEAFKDYRHRYDIEPSFRFDKQILMLDKAQVHSVKALENWIVVVQLARWLLFTASDEVKHSPKKWQKYGDKINPGTDRLTIAQTRKGAESLFLTFDSKPFLPKSINNGKGRQKGEKLVPKKRFLPIKKIKKCLRKHEKT